MHICVSLWIYSSSNSNHEMEILMDEDVKCVDTHGLSIKSEQSITRREINFLCIFLHSGKKELTRQFDSSSNVKLYILFNFYLQIMR